MDLFVYAPAGLVMTVLDDLPGVAAKGRTRISDQVRTARAVGQMAVLFGRADLERRLHSLRTERALRPPAGAPPTEPAPGAAGRPPVAPREPSGAPGPSSSDSAPPSSPPTGPRAPEAATVGPVDQAIPGYDTLSASQVVRRLDSLGPGELAAVHAHESSTRNRRTILSRVEQLQTGATGAPTASMVPGDATADSPATGHPGDPTADSPATGHPGDPADPPDRLG